MTPMDDRSIRWIAHLMGELTPEEHAEVEQEMRENPEEAVELRGAFDGITQWAKQPVAHEAIDLNALTAEVQIPASKGRRVVWPWALAAALLLVALVQGSFSFKIGDSTIAWGQSDDSAQEIADLEGRITALTGFQERLAKDSLELYAAVGEATNSLNTLEAELRIATTELASAQRQEAAVRHGDMRQLLELIVETRAALSYGGEFGAVPAGYAGRP